MKSKGESSLSEDPDFADSSFMRRDRRSHYSLCIEYEEQEDRAGLFDLFCPQAIVVAFSPLHFIHLAVAAHSVVFTRFFITLLLVSIR